VAGFLCNYSNGVLLLGNYPLNDKSRAAVAINAQVDCYQVERLENKSAKTSFGFLIFSLFLSPRIQILGEWYRVY